MNAARSRTTRELRSRAVIVASQVLFLDYDRAHTGLAEEPEIEEQVSRPPRSRRWRRWPSPSAAAASWLPSQPRERRGSHASPAFLYH